MKKVILIAIVIVLILSIISIFAVSQNEKRLEAERQQALSDALYNAELEKIREEREKAEKERQEYLEKLRSYTVYQRLAERTISVNVLYLGDEVTYGAGVARPSEDSWRILLKEKYKKYWSQNVIGTEGSHRHSTDGDDVLDYARKFAKSFVQLYPLHLAYLCIGSDEANTDFAYRYELIVEVVKQNNALADVVCIIQHGQSDEDAEAIMQIAEHYGAICVDMRPLFEGREEELLTEDGLPNVKGNEVYADAIIAEIRKAVDEDKQLIPCPEERLFTKSAANEPVDEELPPDIMLGEEE